MKTDEELRRLVQLGRHKEFCRVKLVLQDVQLRRLSHIRHELSQGVQVPLLRKVPLAQVVILQGAQRKLVELVSQ